MAIVEKGTKFRNLINMFYLNFIPNNLFENSFEGEFGDTCYETAILFDKVDKLNK